MAEQKKDQKVMFIGVDKLQPNPFQPRDKIIEDEQFTQLVNSVTQHGVLEPLVVVETPAGTHIVAGERRWRAAKKVGLEQVPVHMVKTNPKGMLEMAIIENVQRVNLSALEEAQALQRLVSEFNYTQEQVAKKIGKSRQYVQCSIQLLNLPDPIKDGLNQGLITPGHARAIAGAGEVKDMIDVYRTVIAEGASVRRAEALARFKRQQQLLKNQKTNQKMPPILDVDDYVKTWQRNWSKKLLTDATVALTDSRKGTRIVITLKGDPESRKKDLEKIIKMTARK